MSFKKALLFITLLSMILVLSISSYATSEKSKIFKDVGEDHWANHAIKQMAERDIISGYNDSTFKPNQTVSRAEFAKMMVVALNLPINKPQVATFVDVYSDHWVFPYVESAKYYLTGFRTANGDYFRPNRPAVREDMAVALVKALGYTNESYDENILDRFADQNAISSNLKKYVAIAVQKNIMKGTPIGKGQKFMFHPKKPLSRAEAAVLLFNVMEEEKVTYDDGTQPPLPLLPEEPVEDSEEESIEDTNTESYTPILSLSGKVENNKIVLRWQPVSSQGFVYYKVVISKNNKNPVYPQDGYLCYITDSKKTIAVVDNKEPYKNGDFGNYLKPGQKYYFRITAVFKDRKVSSNTVTLAFPGKANEKSETSKYTVPKVYGEAKDGKIVLKWNKINSEGLQGYKIVISKTNPKPKYPEDGYLYWITDRDRTSAVIDNSEPYKNGDFGEYLDAGEKYYFSITAVYNDRKVPGNVLALTFPGV